MSKIPQGEWSAIAARYAQGESISRIAQSYGCTPPAIHYILKRNKARAVAPGEPLNERSQSALAVRKPTRPPSSSAAPLSAEQHSLQAKHDRELSTARSMPSQQPLSPSQQPTGPRRARQAPALTGGLDHELHLRAEAAIEAFRASLDAALIEGSPSVRQRLREAASDLMRVAARTTIVLDRLNANAERGSPRVRDSF
jgi:transposase-like protein